MLIGDDEESRMRIDLELNPFLHEDADEIDPESMTLMQIGRCLIRGLDSMSPAELTETRESLEKSLRK